ncbi:energy-coupling factor ABC transporter ATP-binding protein [Microbacterium sp. SORGH_AS_0862]|uniref:energy-coupling factor ABC transporter ATP-binding protein n=1 Tax=Microbacterium sp. SORGH_AS_0862 TaxID=3041789 RepID=UPI0027907958|nr:ABC transporter ATP-binding protein [Microbacterium sp. SORGH_AS_0862]MDQ1203976.1 biotin transport system ATP-binding protein [Microbacterium sp. SORGH_AS_0862]
MSAIRLERLGVGLGDTEVLRDLDLDLDARTVAVVGDNGSGKSTLARVVGGLVAPSAGTARVLRLDPVRDASELRRRVAIVFSNPDAQIVMPTVAEDVAFSLRGDRMSRVERAERVADALTRFGLAELGDRSAHDLSGGQKQLLALCGAFVRGPELVVADEPTAYLDGRNARIVADHLLADTGHRLLLVTHDLALAERCEAAVHVAEGRVVAVGEARDVVRSYAASLGC